MLRHFIILLGVSMIDSVIVAFSGQFLYQFKFTVSTGIILSNDVYFTTLQLMFVPCGDRRTSPRTLP